MNDDKKGKKTHKKGKKKTLIASGVAMLVTTFAGVTIPADLLLEIWGAMPWV